jgi:hypothetical protein
VRGKTGTTEVASALSGYVGLALRVRARAERAPVNWAAAHKLQDRFVDALTRLKQPT